MMTKILLIDTATEVCSAAIAVNGEVKALVEAPDSLQHAALLTSQVEACVRTSGISLADLDAVAVSRGPGSYTSLRVGVSVAKGICYALNKPLVAVDTLQALALASQTAVSVPGDAPVYYVPMLDARRQEVWTCLYNADMNPLDAPQPLILENNSFIEYLSALLEQPEKAVFVVSGNGAKKLDNVTIFENTVISEIKKCSAAHISTSAFFSFQSLDFQDVAYFEPMYMKPPNITVSNKNLWHEKQ